MAYPLFGKSVLGKIGDELHS